MGGCEGAGEGYDCKSFLRESHFFRWVLNGERRLQEGEGNNWSLTGNSMYKGVEARKALYEWERPVTLFCRVGYTCGVWVEGSLYLQLG